MPVDVEYIRKVAAHELAKRSFDELSTVEVPDTSLDDVFLHKAAQAEDPDLFRIAMNFEGDALKNYETLGGKYKIAGEQSDDITRSAALLALTGAGVGALDGGVKGILPGAGYGALAGGGGAALAHALSVLTKRAFGQPIFQASAAPDPVVTASQSMSLKPPGASGLKAPSATSATSGSGGGTSVSSQPSLSGGGSQNNPMSTPSIPGATGSGGQ